jgi:UDP-glucose 4-epimerase
LLGGSGFIGTALAGSLASRNIAVTVADPTRPGDPDAAWIETDTAGLAARHGDLLEASELLYLLAWSTVPGTAEKDPTADLQQNVMATVALLDSLRELENPPRVVFVSTGGAIYGGVGAQPYRETDCVHPISAYAIGKMVVENYLALFRRQFRLDYLVARPSNPYGIGQRTEASQGAIAVFLGKLLRGEAIEIWGDGEVVRDYLYIDDLAEGLAALADYSPATDGARIFNFGYGKGYSLNSVIDLLGRVSGIRPEVRYTPGRSLDVPAVVLDCGLARRELGWRAEVRLEQGIAKTLNWLRSL